MKELNPFEFAYNNLKKKKEFSFPLFVNMERELFARSNMTISHKVFKKKKFATKNVIKIKVHQKTLFCFRIIEIIHGYMLLLIINFDRLRKLFYGLFFI